MSVNIVDKVEGNVGSPLRILVVDDDELNQRMMRVILSRDGYQVLTASNGLEAIDLVKSQEFDVILMDLQMPIMNGIEASRRIREWESDGKHTFIVALTATYMPEKGRELFEAGVDNYISKPFDLDHLRKILRYSYDGRGVSGNTSTDVSAAFPDFDQKIGLGRVGGDEEIFQELLEEFIHQLPGKQKFLRTCLVNNDFQALFRAAHNLKGVSANLGLLRLSEYARKIEKQENACTPGEIEDILIDMDATVEKLQRDVSEFLSGKKQDAG